MAAALAPDYGNRGCEHYQRYCRILAPCCSNLYSCHICHDEKEDHPINRYTINKLVCVFCNDIQTIGEHCRTCGRKFGNYACLYCFIFDDNAKGQFHCFTCGLCRVGGRENFFHCPKCNMCFALRLKNNHKCVENCSGGSCPLCAEDLHTSRKELHVPPCGHLLHKDCYEELLSKAFMECTVCKKSFS